MNEFSLHLNFIFAFLSTIGFSVYMNSPKEQLIPCGITGAVGWATYYISNLSIDNSIFANFLAALMVSIISEIFARKFKKPAILFIIPGILPLVPGLGLYNTMLYLVQGNYGIAISKGMDVVLIAGAIAIAMLVTISILRTINFFKKKVKI